MLKNLDKAPFPWFGGKANAAEHVWAALGDVEHYCEPFAGSLAVLLLRPHPANRTYYSETVNDIDGMLVNAWRAIAKDPDAVADAASWPVSEADLHARHLALVRWRNERQLEHLMGDPDFYDAKMAGWWMWGQSSWIGSGWCSGRGAWIVGADGRITKRGSKAEPGAVRQLPHISNDGRGVNRPQTREPGLMAADTEPGVWRKRPHISNDGQGVNHPQTREPGLMAADTEPGVWRKRPHIGDDGVGVNHAGTREPGLMAADTEPGVWRKRPHISSDGQGVNRPQTREPGLMAADTEPEYHPMTMPELRRWMRHLSARLRHVRILNGDWTRLVKPGALKYLPVRQGGGVAGVFLDPPYGDTAGRNGDLYAHESLTVAHDVRAWCAANGSDPQYRIALAGFDCEHTELEALGWRCVEWYRAGFLRGGMGNVGGSGKTQAHRDRLWLSPHCLSEDAPAPAKKTRTRKPAKQATIFGDDAQ